MFVLSIITLALDTAVLLGSRAGRFIIGEKQYTVTWSLCGPPWYSESFGVDTNVPTFSEFEP
jgi:hypothetical protein